MPPTLPALHTVPPSQICFRNLPYVSATTPSRQASRWENILAFPAFPFPTAFPLAGTGFVCSGSGSFPGGGILCGDIGDIGDKSVFAGVFTFFER